MLLKRRLQASIICMWKNGRIWSHLRLGYSLVRCYHLAPCSYIAAAEQRLTFHIMVDWLGSIGGILFWLAEHSWTTAHVILVLLHLAWWSVITLEKRDIVYLTERLIQIDWVCTGWFWIASCVLVDVLLRWSLDWRTTCLFTWLISLH